MREATGRTGPTSRPRVGEGRLRGAGPETRAKLTPAALAGSGPDARYRNAWEGTGRSGPTSRPRNNAWGEARRQLALARSQAEAARREAALAGREEAARRGATLSRTEAGGAGPTSRPNNAPSRLGLSYAGGLWRMLKHGLGPASAGAVMGLTAHDIATGAIPDDQVAPEVGGVAGGLSGSWMAAVAAGRLMNKLPGPVRFGGGLLSGLGGWMGGESLGSAAARAAFDPGYVDPDAYAAAEKFFGGLPKPDEGQGLWPWLQRVFDGDDVPEIGNWRGVGLRSRNRGRLDIGQNEPEVWTPPPELLEPEAPRRNRGRLDIGRNQVTVNVGPITVESSRADPREVAEEVADEIERRVRNRNLGLRDVLHADPTPEATY